MRRKQQQTRRRCGRVVSSWVKRKLSKKNDKKIDSK